MDSGRKTRVIVGVLLGLLFVGIVAFGSVFRTVVFTVAAVIAVYEMSGGPGGEDERRYCHNAPRGAVPDAYRGGEGIQ